MPKKGEFSPPPQEKSETTVSSVITPGEDDYTEEALDKVWEEFINVRKDQTGKESETILLRQHKELTEGHKIVLHLGNPVQEQLLAEIQSDLAGHLRRALNNKNISVEGVVTEVEHVKTPYTNREKFEYMAEKNPVVRKLITQLGFDPEY